MSSTTITPSVAARIEPPYIPAATSEPNWVRFSLIAIAVGFAVLFLLVCLLWFAPCSPCWKKLNASWKKPLQA